MFAQIIFIFCHSFYNLGVSPIKLGDMLLHSVFKVYGKETKTQNTDVIISFAVFIIQLFFMTYFFPYYLAINSLEYLIYFWHYGIN